MSAHNRARLRLKSFFSLSFFREISFLLLFFTVCFVVDEFFRLFLVFIFFDLLQNSNVVIVAVDSLENDSSNIHLAVESHASLVYNNVGLQYRFNQVLLHELLIFLVQHDIFWFANQILTIIRHFRSFRVLEEHLLLIEYVVLCDSRVHHWDAFF